MDTTLVVPDIQWPFHDQLMVDKLVQVAADMQPTQIIQIGDGIDFPTVSRWTVGTAAAYAPELQEHIDGYRDGFLVPMRQAAPQAAFKWLRGNHDERLEDFVNKYAAPLRTLRALSMDSLFGLRELDVEYVKGPVRIATNTYAVHGHESGGYSAQPQAWDLKFLRRYGSEKSVVFGHTHQPYLTTRAFGFDGKVTPRFTMNVGSIMDPTHAKYVKDGAVNWTMSFGLLRDNGKEVWPELVVANRRQFWVNGRKY